MAKKTAKYIGLFLIAVMFFGVVAFACPVRAVNVNVNQDTFVLSNEAPGYGMSALVNAGYANYSLYDTLLAIRAGADPSVSSILTDAFLSTLGNAPASAKIFTTQLKDVNSQGVAIGINTDGTLLTNGVIIGMGNFTTLTHGDIFGSTYNGKQGITSLDIVISSVGSFRLVYNSSGPLTSWTVNGPLAGMTTTYNVFGILYIPSGTPTPTPTISPTITTQPTPTPSVPEFSSLTILFALTVIATLVAVVAIKKENNQTRKHALNCTSFLVTNKYTELMT
jgi:hypothetical protein